MSDAIDLTQERREYTPKADLAEVRRNYEYDMDKFLKYSSTRDINPDPAALTSYLVSAYHSLEKGLAMEVPKAGFGLRKIRPVLAAIAALENSGAASVATRGARGCMRAYVQYHDDRGLPLPVEVEAELRAFVAGMVAVDYPGGSITLNRKEIEEATNFDYDRFIQTRCSVRHFTGESVSPEEVKKAVQRAIKTPRTCNREMRRVYAAYDPELRNDLLSYHNGNRGFGHKLGAVLVVTVDLREFDMIGERNQGWIDGGLFAMSLVYALHAGRLGTCMLNWSEDCVRDQRVRDAFQIPDHEIIITFVGVGHLPDSFEVAASPAPSADEVLSIIAVRPSGS
ncbi:nitroreductase family protein [Gluconobacter cerinus]|uniref:nitroreductase family protein n=1 Tax=Gluconobacter cerinus TaxID=38307 RepID=UPI00207B278A|nr:nitroreductase family protein [Gluconobacter cerinus]